ncbi:DUF1440 domain-containing protein [Halpernia frigidisoli]|uniref:Uncharacterized membrane protein YagU, involved in acid resistance, DUF1440 family n=1 Tax=Halpernia frigidisoli TaxID=1125876 RepID=A0A1I3E269_9FLAO|nr:DUF1440 domain-containing protein [Halpernia frigidisoli]SFH93074.1 Uncharacterized membrane protein YagU, involved in acid resistance, DUF1440 family [Halpernia frigidisoli]
MKTQKIILVGIATGLFASWLKSLSEPPLEKLGLKYFPATEEELNLKGADLINHPENMPPAVLAKKNYQFFKSKPLSDKEAIKFLPFIHYTLGIAIGISYIFARNKDKKVAILGGIPAGAVIFAATHGSIIPALGLQDNLRKMPKSWWVWEFGSHLLFGFFVEQSTKIFKKII